MTLAPVPARDQVTVQINEGTMPGSIITIYNVLGELMHSESIGARDRITVDVSAFSSGLYVVEYSNTEFSLTEKFIKN